MQNLAKAWERGNKESEKWEQATPKKLISDRIFFVKFFIKLVEDSIGFAKWNFVGLAHRSQAVKIVKIHTYFFVNVMRFI
ncbi:MAG TPA: hypothetical protein DCM71_02070 [Runella sp.]|nr:hypothetical protein [Runella sp.]